MMATAAKRKRPTAGAPLPVAESAVTGQPPSRPGSVATPGPLPSRRQSSRGARAAAPSSNANSDVRQQISALRDSPGGREGDASLPVARRPRVGNARRAQNSASAVAEGPLQGDHATTEVVADGQGRHGPVGSAHAACPGGGAAPAGASETPSADLPPRPGRKKGKRGPPQHVKVDGALPDNPASKALLLDAARSSEGAVRVDEDVGVAVDPEVDEGPKGEDEAENEEEVEEALSRPPPVNSDFLPLPWKGRLGYACLNTYLRNANPPVFSSRTCRIASILENRHPLKDPSQPSHPTKNRPDKDQPADITRGQRYVEELGLANTRDIIKIVRWNDKYGIKFMRLSSETFPFASHLEHGYKLAPFASKTLAEAGKVIAELGHRVTTHPGQFTQLGSPRKEVIDASIRDLEYHDEMLSLLKLPPQQDRDAVMILHLGGAFGDKAATLDRFRENYAKLSGSIKRRLVLENDDVVWSVHDLLPLCQELNIPFVLDFHHHNIVFDSTKIREGTKDIVELFPPIIETWTRKGMTPKMHYSEPCPDAVTARSKRKHSPRVMTLPPCPPTMDLMIEAKDKEQAVFQLMRTFRLPGFDLLNDVVPHIRLDENKPFKPKARKVAKKGKKKKVDELDALDERIEGAVGEEKAPPLIPEEEVGMGGPQRQVFWPVGMEHWLRPPKRVVTKKEAGAGPRVTKKRKATVLVDEDAPMNGESCEEVQTPARKPAPKSATGSAKKRTATKSVPRPSPSSGDSSLLGDVGDGEEDGPVVRKETTAPAPTRKRSGRVSRVSYKEEEVGVDEMIG